jgi:hypothetical protein
MFYGLRLVCSIVLSKVMLGATLITDALQVRKQSWGASWGAVANPCPSGGVAGGLRHASERRLHRRLQIVGAVVTVAAVTIYLAFQWRDSQRAVARAAADKAAEAAAAAEEEGGAQAVPPADGGCGGRRDASHPGSELRV